MFEPAVDLTELPLGNPLSTLAARQALDAGRPGTALEIFLRDMVGAPPPAARLARLLALSPRFRTQLIPGQIADQEALERLGDHRSEYSDIRQHVLLIGGTESPERFRHRIELLHRVLLFSDVRQLERAGHTGPVRKARALADLLLTDIRSWTPA